MSSESNLLRIVFGRDLVLKTYFLSLLVAGLSFLPQKCNQPLSSSLFNFGARTRVLHWIFKETELLRAQNWCYSKRKSDILFSRVSWKLCSLKAFHISGGWKVVFWSLKILWKSYCCFSQIWSQRLVCKNFHFMLLVRKLLLIDESLERHWIVPSWCW